MALRSLFAIGAAAALVSHAAAQLSMPNTLTEGEKASGWALLFDGKTLDGWTTGGELSAWTVEKGEDNGTVLTMAHPGKGWWLRTVKMYRDFELSVDFDVAKGMNSGVGLRGSSVGDPAFTGMEIQVFGNQGEKPTITCCGSVYDACTPDCSGVPGGLLPLKDGGQWNTYQIKLVGDTLNIWMNGVHIQKDQKLDGRGYTHKPEDKNPLDSRCRTGFIALQDHGDKVRFRNLKIKDLSADKDPGGFVPIFNGHDTKGWTTQGFTGDGKWRIEDGVLVGSNVGLATEKPYKEFELRVFAKCAPGATGAIGVGQRPVDLLTISGEGWKDYRLRIETNKTRAWVDGKELKDALPNMMGAAPVFVRAAEGEVMFKDIQVREVK